MSNKMYNAFDQIHAEDALKQKTRESVFEAIEKKKHRTAFGRAPRMVFTAMALCLCIGFGGHQVYFTEAFALSVDVNPSIEMGINRFNKVISVEGCNEDGSQILSSLDVKNKYYGEAIDQIVEEERRYGYLADNDEVSIAVVCDEEEKFKEIKDNISSCTIQDKQQVSVDKCKNELVEKAHEVGMSFGKYAAVQQLQEVKPEVTIDEAKEMTMSEIKAQTNGANQANNSDSTTATEPAPAPSDDSTASATTAPSSGTTSDSQAATTTPGTTNNAQSDVKNDGSSNSNAQENSSTNVDTGKPAGNGNGTANGTGTTNVNGNGNDNANGNGNGSANGNSACGKQNCNSNCTCGKANCTNSCTCGKMPASDNNNGNNNGNGNGNGNNNGHANCNKENCNKPNCNNSGNSSTTGNDTGGTNSNKPSDNGNSGGGSADGTAAPPDESDAGDGNTNPGAAKPDESVSDTTDTEINPVTTSNEVPVAVTN